LFKFLKIFLTYQIKKPLNSEFKHLKITIFTKGILENKANPILSATNPKYLLFLQYAYFTYNKWFIFNIFHSQFLFFL